MSEGESFARKKELSIRHEGRKILGGEGGKHSVNAACILDEELHRSVMFNSDRPSPEGLAAKGMPRVVGYVSVAQSAARWHDVQGGKAQPKPKNELEVQIRKRLIEG